jgi:hypothetical protein
MQDTKPWWASRTVITGLIGTLVAVCSAIGLSLPVGLSQEQILEAVLAVTGVLSVLFRSTATKTVTTTKQ